MTSGRPAMLIVGEEAELRETIADRFGKSRYDVAAANDGVHAMRLLSQQPWDLVLLDVRATSRGGMELLHRIQQLYPDVASIIVADDDSVSAAEAAVEAGAYDYVARPVDPEQLSRIVSRAMERRGLQKENLSLHTHMDALDPEEELIGDSEEISTVRERIRSVSQTDASVLIQGETGTGKGLVARLIHRHSPRRDCPLVAINCDALPESLLESELFGHENASPTAGHYRHRGKLEVASGGTLFLDEVGALAPRTQGNLLGVFETREFSSLGGNQVIAVDLRVIAATNQKLEELVNEKRFREDFYNRINVSPINIPPLRERRRDILLCARHFMGRFSRQLHKSVTDISPGAADLMLEYPWPGNVRELKNAVERAVIVTRVPELLPGDLPLSQEGIRRQAEGDSMSAIEKAHIIEMLKREGWNITRTARTLGIDRVTLYNKIKKYGLRK